MEKEIESLKAEIALLRSMAEALAKPHTCHPCNLPHYYPNIQHFPYCCPMCGAYIYQGNSHYCVTC